MKDNAPVRSLSRFFPRVIIALIVITGVWWYLVGMVSQPGAYLAGFVLEKGFAWVEATVVTPVLLEVDTSIKVIVPVQSTHSPAVRNTVAFLVGELDPRKYSYSLPLLLALLVAGYSRQRGWRILAGGIILFPFHAFSMVMVVLKDLAIEGGASAVTQMGLSQWHLELIAFGYQLGTLLVPTLVPIMIWFWLDRQTVACLMPLSVRHYFSPEMAETV